MSAADTPTLIPSTWPTDAELCPPVVVPRYPAVPCTDDRATWVPVAASEVRRCGGILEHPAYSDAWPAFNLPTPNRHGGWTGGICGGFSAHVEQWRYGHPAKKATWLYAYGVKLPDLRWGSDLDARSTALVSWCGNRVRSGERRPRVGKHTASRTPIEFAHELIGIAASANGRTKAA